jgi:hypothetical protein
MLVNRTPTGNSIIANNNMFLYILASMGIYLHISYLRNYSHTSVLHMVLAVIFIRMPYEIKLFLCMPLRHMGK